ncbi:probable serine/threonine-protein kinase tsuA [Papaver somniferum]|uniref:probable serine/threonine-protein kinase tsuA n=1 Tax=Papaver somniferum TaxID=3469 RepID=UPI000E6F737F|nr:probable serine/threonine-protein kinase tsuA [Papaver somniferum]XP_026432668.1 probable serine/threonine-protein kinase tsuA [Papaver somniferum]
MSNGKTYDNVNNQGSLNVGSITSNCGHNVTVDRINALTLNGNNKNANSFQFQNSKGKQTTRTMHGGTSSSSPVGVTKGVMMNNNKMLEIRNQSNLMNTRINSKDKGDTTHTLVNKSVNNETPNRDSQYLFTGVNNAMEEWMVRDMLVYKAQQELNVIESYLMEIPMEQILRGDQLIQLTEEIEKLHNQLSASLPVIVHMPGQVNVHGFLE